MKHLLTKKEFLSQENTDSLIERMNNFWAKRVKVNSRGEWVVYPEASIDFIDVKFEIKPTPDFD